MIGASVIIAAIIRLIKPVRIVRVIMIYRSATVTIGISVNNCRRTSSIIRDNRNYRRDRHISVTPSTEKTSSITVSITHPKTKPKTITIPRLRDNK